MQLNTETLRFIQAHRHEDVRVLALQAAKFPLVDMPAALIQIAGLQIAAEKIPSWYATEGILYPKHLSLEQCSSEMTARYKASLIQGDTLVDLTGGFGIDCAFLSAGFGRVTYVEQQEELCRLAAHNFQTLKLRHIKVENSDGVEYLRQMLPADCIFIDPARRNEQGGKTIAIADCTPDVAELQELLLSKAQTIIVKLSPMLDLSLALRDVPCTKEVHIISVNNECKELLLVLTKTTKPPIPIYCINLTNETAQNFSFTREEEQESACLYTDAPEAYLYEPNASILKAGAFKSVSSIYKVKKLHPNSHLYTSDKWIENFPGRAFRIMDVCSFNKNEIRRSLEGVKKANISVRNFPASVAEIRKRLKLADGGEVYLFASTLNNEKKVFIKCLKE
ncbi:SAM-dependent methyltransferase [uncultured Bacteroides sp.]|uniref:class I SAM-dependent methyltransferase n=1 Tax=uncultured Bacteroides sp. TaxID=162156 RepID=UPI002AA6BBDF|nr:SAM-dependent methyltransferase [uncultured Bacteroides sp.]